MLKTGPYDIKIETPRINYEFRINRKITIIRGNSGTGKSYLQNIIFESKDRESRDYITINSKVPLVAFRSTWETQKDLDSLASINDSIIFLDEDYKDINTPEFARVVKNSSSYFVIITRSELSNLPYSIHEIYKINNSGKFNYLEPIYEDNILGNKGLIPDILSPTDKQQWKETQMKRLDSYTKVKMTEEELENYYESRKINVLSEKEINELINLFENVSNKFNRITKDKQNEINHTNLVNSIKNIARSKGLDPTVFYNRHCLIKDSLTTVEQGLSLIVNGFWIFTQINHIVMNKEAYTLKIMNSKKRNLEDMFSFLNFTTILQYGFYLEIDEGYEKLTYEKLKESLNRMEVKIDEKFIR